MLLISLLLSGLLLIVVGFAYWYSRPALMVALVATILLPMYITSGAVFLNWLLVAVAAIGCCLAKSSAARFIAYSLAATGFVYSAMALLEYSEYQTAVQLRLQYPEQSLRERLAYEQPASSQNASSVITAPSSDYGLRSRIRESRAPHAKVEPPLTLQELAGIDMLRIKFDTESNGNRSAHRRRRALASLSEAHQGFVTQFIQSPGFGVTRTLRVPARQEYIEIPQFALVPLPEPVTGNGVSSADVERWPENCDAPEDVARHGHLAELHTDSVVNFANPIGFGYVPRKEQQGTRGWDLERVSGFQPHGFTRMPELSFPEDPEVRWQIGELQLVSLLKQETPGVYLSQHLPQMEQLSNARTRALDPFEAGALERLRAGEDLVVAERRNELRMLGSIRAVTKCGECHQASEGALLGAFSYCLLRDPPLAAPPRVLDDGQPLTGLIRGSHEADAPARKHEVVGFAFASRVSVTPGVDARQVVRLPPRPSRTQGVPPEGSGRAARI